jgi:hypothetical protein
VHVSSRLLTWSGVAHATGAAAETPWLSTEAALC